MTNIHPYKIETIIADIELQRVDRSTVLTNDLFDTLCIHHIVETYARLSPQSIAIVDEHEHLTYKELDQQANQVAQYLRRLGSSPRQPVGIYMEQSVRAVVGMLGSFKAGSPYVPIDTRYPHSRVTTILDEAGIEFVLTNSILHSSLVDSPYTLVNVDEEWSEIVRESPEPPFDEIDESDLAYIIFTSGTTGKPKGVEIEHRNLRNLVQWHQEAFQVTEQDRATLFASISFDASVWELWPYLCSGASVYVVPKQVQELLSQLQAWLIEKEITINFLPTPLAEQVITLDWPTDVALRIMLTGGDRLHVYPPTSLPFTFVNNYGPTENTVVATSGIVQPRSEGEEQSLPSIGKPICNVDIFLLDEHLKPVADGEAGEIYIAGMSQARGYRHQPQLTNERFVPHPFSDDPAARLYKTGDLAQWNEDGTLLFLGRNDQQVKVRGFRIELAEIQVRLGSYPGIRESSVIALPDDAGENQLIAFFVSKEGHAAISIDALRDYLKQTLPDYMVPAHFVKLDALPLSTSGKVDRQKLASLYVPQEEQEQAELVTDNATEQQLIQIWSQLLKGHQFGLHNDFFKIGGHSLSVLQLIVQVRKTFQVSLTVRDIFQTPTIVQLATIIEEKQRVKALR